jgi:hypothetical protein
VSLKGPTADAERVRTSKTRETLHNEAFNTVAAHEMKDEFSMLRLVSGDRSDWSSYTLLLYYRAAWCTGGHRPRSTRATRTRAR